MAANVAVANPNIQTPVFGSQPCEQPRSISSLLNFATNTSYILNLTQYQNNKQFTTLQTIYVDNTGNGSSLTMSIDKTGQTITIPAGRGGYFNVLACVPATVTFASAGAVSVYVALLNFYVPGIVWGN